MKQLLDLIHILLCDKKHEHNMIAIIERNPNLCYFYLENDISEGDKMEDHLKWYDNMEGFKAGMSLADDKEALDFLQNCIKLSHKVQDLSCGNPYRKAFIKQLLEF